MTKFKSIFFYFDIIFIFILLIIGIITNSIVKSPGLLIVVVPLIIYFWGYLLINSKKVKIPQNNLFWIFVSILLIFNLLGTIVLFFANIFFARTFFDVIISFFYLPFPLYFLFTIVDWYKKVVQNNLIQIKLTKEKTAETGTPLNVDLDRRKFLKILGATGASVFLLSLLNPKQAGAAFFGSVPGPGTVSLKDASGTKINPAEKHPTDGYKISQLDSATYPHYYGYVNQSGAWYIMKEDDLGNYRYTKGTTGFSANWTLRADLTYDYFNTIFS